MLHFYCNDTVCNWYSIVQYVIVQYIMVQFVMVQYVMLQLYYVLLCFYFLFSECTKNWQIPLFTRIFHFCAAHCRHMLVLSSLVRPIFTLYTVQAFLIFSVQRFNCESCNVCMLVNAKHYYFSCRLALNSPIERSSGMALRLVELCRPYHDNIRCRCVYFGCYRVQCLQNKV